MTKENFLAALRHDLVFLSEDEINEKIKYYDDFISRSGNEEEEIMRLGSPEGIASAIKEEYYKKRTDTQPRAEAAVNRETNNKRKNNHRLTIILISLLFAVGIPAMDMIYGILPMFVTIIIVVIAIALCIFLLIKMKQENRKLVITRIETASDINSLEFNFRCGTFAIEQSTSLRIGSEAEEGKLRSYVSKGVWHLDSDFSDMSAVPAAVSVMIPKNMELKNVNIHMSDGNLLLDSLSADAFEVKSDNGRMDIKNVQMNKLDASCGQGSIDFSGTVRKSIKLNCGLGKINMRLYNSEDYFNIKAKTGLGRITAGSKATSGTVKTINVQHNAPANINAVCGMGAIDIRFAGQAEAEVAK